MEQQDLDLILKWMDQDPELKQRMEEHRELEERLDEFKNRAYLTPEETVERKRLQKQKLAGRDQIENILAKYRDKDKPL